MSWKKVLIVDDEPDLVETVRFALEAEGFSVLVAQDGEEGLKSARAQRPDLMILDLMLPKIDGYKVCRLLKFDERYKHIPIVMVTAKAQGKDRAMAAEAGADAYITKPFDLDELVITVKGYLNKKV